MRSRTPQGVRGLKCRSITLTEPSAGRTPQGVRGLQFGSKMWTFRFYLSHPARGAWIEISIADGFIAVNDSRTPQGVRGLKLLTLVALMCSAGRTPQGVRGLKSEIA